MYLLYPTTAENSFDIFEIPDGQTAEELATSFGLSMLVCAEFDLEDFDPGSDNFSTCFTFVDNQPLPNGADFDLPSAKELASVVVKARYDTEQTIALNGFSSQALAAQATLAEVDRIPAVQEVITQVNSLAVQLEADLAAITAATSVTEVSNIAYPPTSEV